ncbi:FAD-binding oxidoreductase [Paeniglutamicibacter sp. NPDC012692]|uniref:FAD-binding oxidoreductase n=1 Tax=Paeniglutamicibacter sp. NPDC012692 TaxID=3364388 RepID=UPI00368ADD0E
MSQPTDFDAEGLRAKLDGSVLVPGDAGFEAACLGFNLAHAFRPDVAVLAGSTRDVMAAVRHANEADLSVHVQSTGHGYPHQDHGGMLINTSGMQSLALDPQQRSARVGAGVRWTRVIEEAAPHGLAPLNGSSPDVGVVGYTLGGGMGPMGRTFGFAADQVRGIQLVTADGSLVEVNAESEPELFWALRGGKCAVGIVTELEFDLVSVPRVYGGAIFFAGSDAPAIMHAYGAWVQELPESTTASIALLRLPDDEQIPEPLRGKLSVHLRFVHVGDETAGAALLEPMRRAGTPLVDLVGMMSYTAIASVHQDPTDPMPVWEGSMLLSGLDAAAIDALLGAAGPDHDVPLIMAEIRHLGGALSRGPEHENAVGGRDAAFSMLVVGPYPPPLMGAVEAAGNAVLEAMKPWAHGGSQINFQGFAGTPEAVRKAWAEPTVERLRALKTAWDPECRFSFGYSMD